jgi:hypothetical protein
MFYKLKGKKVVPCESMEVKPSAVAKTQIHDVSISTIFLGLDHSYGEGPPIVFETMIFGGKFDQEQWRYSSFDDAVEGHTSAVKLVMGGK